MRFQSPEKLWESALERLPPKLGDFLWNAGCVLAWVTLPAWFVSTVADLQITVKFGEWLLNHSGALVGIVLAAFHIIGDAVRVWRTFLSPLTEWVGTILPFRVPAELTEFIVASAPLIPSLVRLWYSRHLVFEPVRRAKDIEVRVHIPQPDGSERIEGPFRGERGRKMARAMTREIDGARASVTSTNYKGMIKSWELLGDRERRFYQALTLAKFATALVALALVLSAIEYFNR